MEEEHYTQKFLKQVATSKTLVESNKKTKTPIIKLLQQALLQPYSVQYKCLITAKIAFLEENLTKSFEYYSLIQKMDRTLNFIKIPIIREQLSDLEQAQILMTAGFYDLAEQNILSFIDKRLAKLSNLNKELNEQKNQQNFNFFQIQIKDQENAPLQFNKSPCSVAQAYYLLGNVKILQDQFWEAIQKYEKCINFDEKFYLAYLNMGFCQSRFFRQDQALDLYAKSIQVYENNYLGYHNIGMIHCQNKNYQIALKYFIKAVEINPAYDKGLLEIGCCLEALGEKQESLMFYLQASILDEQNLQKVECYNTRMLLHSLYDICKKHLFTQKRLKSQIYNIYNQSFLGRAIFRLDIIKEISLFF